jgi:hypothetical protein
MSSPNITTQMAGAMIQTPYRSIPAPIANVAQTNPSDPKTRIISKRIPPSLARRTARLSVIWAALP